MSYLPWLAGGAALGLAARRGQRAPATNTRGLGVWVQRGARNMRLLLYRPGVLAHIWAAQVEGGISGIPEYLTFGTLENDEPLVYATARLRGEVEYCGGWELMEVAALPGYGPMIFDLALAAVGAREGIFPDQTSLSPQAKQMFRNSSKTGKYDLVPTKKAICRRQRGKALTSRYLLQPKLRTSWKRKLKRMEAYSQEGIDAIDWDKPMPRGVGGPDAVDRWLAATSDRFFRTHYFGSDRGRRG